MELETVFAYKDLDYTDGCDIVTCDMCGKKTVVPSWAENCPECGYLAIDNVEEGLTIRDIEKRYIIVWKDTTPKQIRQ